jgi:hypothetical protein
MCKHKSVKEIHRNKGSSPTNLHIYNFGTCLAGHGGMIKKGGTPNTKLHVFLQLIKRS